MPTIDERLAALTAVTEENTRNIRQLAMIVEESERRAERIMSTLEKIIESQNQLVQSQAEMVKDRKKMQEMLDWLIRNVRQHEERIDRVEGRRPT